MRLGRFRDVVVASSVVMAAAAAAPAHLLARAESTTVAKQEGTAVGAVGVQGVGW